MPNTVSTYLPDAMKARFDQFVTASGKKRGEIVREAIDEYMAKRTVEPVVYPSPDTESLP